MATRAPSPQPGQAELAAGANLETFDTTFWENMLMRENFARDTAFGLC